MIHTPFIDPPNDEYYSFGDEGPQEPEDYLELHLNGFMPIGEHESFQDKDGTLFDAIVTDMELEYRPKFWITDEIWIEVDIGGIWEISEQKFTDIRLDIDLYYDGDIIASELHTVEKRFTGWPEVHTLKEFVKDETNKFLSDWASKFNSFKFTDKTWEGDD